MIMKCTEIRPETYKYASYLSEENKKKGLFIELNENSPETQIYYDSIKTLSHTGSANGDLKVKA